MREESEGKTHAPSSLGNMPHASGMSCKSRKGGATQVNQTKQQKKAGESSQRRRNMGSGTRDKEVSGKRVKRDAEKRGVA